MRQTITCSACGTVLGVPKAGMPRDGLSCNWCGYVTLPASEPAPVPKPVPRPSPAPVTAAPAAPADTAAPHPWAADEDDNGLPDVLPPGEVKTRKCQACGAASDLLAVVCVHCGF